MIHVTFSLSEDGETLCMGLQGHAGYAEKGQDIVCAAASILAYTLAQAVSGMQQAGQLRKQPRLELGEGAVNITCKPKRKAMGEAWHSFAVIQDGYRLLASSYGEYISLKTLLGTGQ